MKKAIIFKIEVLFILVVTVFSTGIMQAQEVEVQGELKVTQMNENDNVDDLVIRNTDGTLGTRDVASLPPPPPPIEDTRNLASDYELAELLCNCYNLPPFLIKKLLDSGYTPEELVGSGIPVEEVIDAQRGGILIDTRDNRSYKTVTIGTQTWKAENLDYGMRIDGVDDQTENDVIEKYCYDDLSYNCDTYGALYQWDEMMQYTTSEGTQGVCPPGWHLPTDDEWKTLEMALGMTQTHADGTGFRGTDQGSQLAGDEYLWTDGSLVQNGVFGSSGFDALPAGIRVPIGSFNYQSTTCDFWSSSESGADAWDHGLNYNIPQVGRFPYSKSYGISVRCVKD